MFESKLAGVLNQVLGSYVHGISTDDLKVAVFKGDVVLTNMRLKVEALNALGLPFRVRSGVVGRLTLRVPWRALGKSPVMVLIEDVHVVAGFADAGEAGGRNGDDEPAAAEARADAARAEETRALVDAGETAWLAGGDAEISVPAANDAVAAQSAASTSGSGDGYFAGMLDTILGNLEVTVHRIHLRLEGELGDVSAAASAPRDRFALGMTLESMELHTVDAEGAPAFSTKGLAERMRKSATLTRLAVYFDVGAESLKPPDAASWDEVAPDALAKIMAAGVSSSERDAARNGEASRALIARAEAQVRERAYVLAPVSASALYERRGARDAFDAAVPAQRVFLRVDAIETRVASSHLRVAFETAARLERDARRAPHAHVRPKASVTQAPREWWAFARAAVTLERRRKGKVTAVPLRLDRVVEAMRARRAYVEAYAAYVRGAWRERPKARARAKQGWFSRRSDDPSAAKRWPPPLAVGAAPELDAIERKLPANVCVLFRALAHAQVRRELGDADVSTGGEEERASETSGGGWMSGWFGSKNGVGAGVGASGSGSGPAEAGESGNVETEMSEEDWSNLQRVFDVEGHAEVAVAASASAVDDGVASEFSVAVGTASVAFVDDEIVSDDAPEPLGARTKHVEVLRAGLVGFVAGSRTFGGARADHRAAVDAMDVDMSGAKMVRVAGEDSNGAAAADAAFAATRGSAAAAHVAERLWRDDEDDVFYDDDAYDADGAPVAASKALRLKFLNAPLGDCAPDVDLGVTLAPAHVVALRAPVDRLVETLSRHKPAQLAEQEEMLRRAVTESASRTAAAARERLAASLADRPEVNVSVVVHAPRVAAPSFRFAAGDDEADADAATVILDLGRFQLDSCGALELGATPETAKLFNAFKIRVSDVSASVASGRWDPSRAWTVETFDDVAPVIPAFGARATALQALAPVSGRAGLEVTFDADAVRVALSPHRVAQLLSVVANVSATAPAPAGRPAAALDDASVADDDSLIGEEDPEELIGWTMCQILVVSFGRLRWSSCRARVREDAGVPSLEFYGVGPAQSRRVAAPLPLAGGGALRVSREAAAREHAVAVCADAAAVDAASFATKRRGRSEDASGRLRGLVERPPAQGRVVLIGLDSDELAERFRERVNSAARASARSAVPAAAAAGGSGGAPVDG
jgi:vacuolar protein sorting-associated protein 13A/C